MLCVKRAIDNCVNKNKKRKIVKNAKEIITTYQLTEKYLSFVREYKDCNDKLFLTSFQESVQTVIRAKENRSSLILLDGGNEGTRDYFNFSDNFICIRRIILYDETNISFKVCAKVNVDCYDEIIKYYGFDKIIYDKGNDLIVKSSTELLTVNDFICHKEGINCVDAEFSISCHLGIMYYENNHKNIKFVENCKNNEGYIVINKQIDKLKQVIFESIYPLLIDNFPKALVSLIIDYI